MTTSYTYDILYPEQYNPDQKYPVIFAMHGMGSNEKDLPSMLGGVSDKFIIISIRGHLTQGNGFAFFSIKSIGNPDREIFDDSVRNLQDFIQYATEKYPIDPKKRYLLGFSQGSIMSMSLALTMGEEIKGIVALSGYIPSFVKNEYEKKSVAHTSVFISHGEYDPIFPIHIGNETKQYFLDQGSNVTYKTYAAGHEVTPQNVKDLTDWLLRDSMNQ